MTGIPVDRQPAGDTVVTVGALAYCFSTLQLYHSRECTCWGMKLASMNIVVNNIYTGIQCVSPS